MSILARLTSSIFAVSLALAFAAPLARAEDGEKSIPSAEVPKAVVDAVAKKFPGGTVKAWAREEEDKKVSYEARVEIPSEGKNGAGSTRHIEATLSEDGKILAEEEVVGTDALPDAVTKSISATAYAKAKIVRVERKILGEKPESAQYEIVFEIDGKRSEVTFDAAGKVLEEETPDESEKKESKDGGKKSDTPKVEPGMGSDSK